MLVLNYADGRSETFSLDREEEARALAERARGGAFLAGVRGLALVVEGTRLVAPVDRRANVEALAAAVELDAARVPWGERARVVSGGVETVLTISFANPRTARVDVRKVGRVRYRSRPPAREEVRP